MMRTLTAALAGTAMGLCALAATAQPYDEFAGQTVVAIFPQHPHYDAVMQVLPQFTEETGIQVEVDQQQYLAMREKQTLELTRDQGDYDLMGYVVFSKADYVYADQIEPLARFFMDPKLANPDYDADDLFEGYMKNIGFAGGEKGYLDGATGGQFGIPFGAETSVLAYRTDIFEKHGLEPPETYEEMLDLACRIPELEPGMGGIASRGQSGHQTSHAFLLHLAPLGGGIFDESWEPIVNDARGVEAGEALKTILDCGPEGATSFGYAEAKNAFLSGQAAMILDSTAIGGEIDNPELSQVVGNVAFVPHPCAVECASQTGRLRPRDPAQRAEQGGGVPADAVADLQGGGQGHRARRRLALAALDHAGPRGAGRVPAPGGLRRGAGRRRSRLAPDHPRLGRDQLRAGHHAQHGDDRRHDRAGGARPGRGALARDHGAGRLLLLAVELSGRGRCAWRVHGLCMGCASPVTA